MEDIVKTNEWKISAHFQHYSAWITVKQIVRSYGSLTNIHRIMWWATNWAKTTTTTKKRIKNTKIALFLGKRGSLRWHWLDESKYAWSPKFLHYEIAWLTHKLWTVIVNCRSHLHDNRFSQLPKKTNVSTWWWWSAFGIRAIKKTIHPKKSASLTSLMMPPNNNIHSWG